MTMKSVEEKTHVEVEEQHPLLYPRPTGLFWDGSVKPGMLLWLVLSFFSGSHHAHASGFTTGDCGYRYETNRFEPTITNGTTTKSNEFPWHVAIFRVGEDSIDYICGGSIIDSIVVVTAAHCIFDEGTNDIDTSDLYVVTGKYHRSWDIRDPKERRFKVVRKKIKKTYLGEKNRYQDDIALLALNETIRFDSLVMPICIDWSGRHERSIQDSHGLIAGWGLTENGTLSEKLLLAELRHFDFTDCRRDISEGYTNFVTSDKFCTQGLDLGGVDQGDSGGGLIFPITNKDGNQQYYIYGVLSGRDKNATDFATFTNFTMHMYWLNSTRKNIGAELIAREACGKKYPVSYTDTEGRRVLHYDYPWLATIYMEREGEFFGVRCVGSIIHPRAIITSAWCLQDIPDLYQPAKYHVLVGKHELNMDNKEPTERRYEIEKIHKHENYVDSGDRSENDIAIIIVDDDIRFTKAIVPICLDYDKKINMHEDPRKLGMIVSWNTIDCHCQQEATYKYISNDKCENKFKNPEEYQKFITAEKFCGEFVRGTEFLYSSDAGSGLIYSRNTTSGHYIYGVVCKGRPTNGQVVPFTKIDASLRWISDTLDTIYNAGGS